MNTEQTKHAIKVMQAFVEGKSIERRGHCSVNKWKPVTTPQWAWDTGDYRVAPEPITVYVPVVENLSDYHAYHTEEGARECNVNAVRIAKCVEVVE